VHRGLLRPALRLLFGVGRHGREHVPDEGPFVLAANHNSHLDVLLLFSALPARRIRDTRALAARDYFARNRGLFRGVDFLFRPIWVDREKGGSDPVAEMHAHLDRGGGIIVFPEGTRGEPGRIAPFHRGVGRVVESRPGLPVIPAFLLGPERALPRGAPVPLPLWNHVFLGPPQSLTGTAEDVTDALREAILALAGSETADAHRRRPRKREALVVAVLGIDGSGKSTLARRLAMQASTDARTCLIGDALELFSEGAPRAAQPLLVEKLRAWVSRRAKAAKSLAFYKVPKIAELLLRDALLGEAKRWYGPDLVFLDGSPLLNMTAWSVLYREEFFDEAFCAQALGVLTGSREVSKEDPIVRRFPELTAMRRLGLLPLARPDAVCFLDVDPAVSMERILRRGESVQVHENEEKLGKLRDAYRLVIAAYEREFGLPARVIDGNRDVETVTADGMAFLAEAREHRPARTATETREDGP
jgi:1-acyl-sn-glycerol-3-phosphate acyltransferase